MGQGSDSCRGWDVDAEYDDYHSNLMDGEWRMKDGSVISVTNMKTSHIHNAIRLCRAISNRCNFSSDSELWDEWIDVFEEELSSRREVKEAAKNKESSEYSSKKVVRGAKVERTCQCGAKYEARVADLKRGWGLSCSKSCAAKRR